MPNDLAAFLAGFLEGEACFRIQKQARGPYGCVMGLCARDDDEPLLRDLMAATRLGTLRRRRARETSQPQVIWRVLAKADCQRLIELLDKYPLRGRKSHDYALWRAAANWWIGSDPRTRPSARDWTPMAYLQQRLSECKRYGASDPLSSTDSFPGLTGDWPGFLSGFLTAEGHFGINLSNPNCYRPRLSVNLRADDADLLRELCTRTTCGRVYRHQPKGRKPPVTAWVVFSRADLMRIVQILDGLPPRGRKRREYDVWRQAVLEYAKPGPRRPIHERLGELCSELAEASAYSPARST